MANAFGLVKGMLLAGCGLALAIGFMADGSPDVAPAAAPQPGQETAGQGYAAYGEMVVERGPDGHYWLDAEVNGETIRFLVDTGASHVILTQDDAQAVGLHLTAADYTAVYQTANGEARAAPVLLNRVEVGDIALTDVVAAVNGAPLPQSLLGMSFLQRLSGFEIQGERMILRP